MSILELRHELSRMQRELEVVGVQLLIESMYVVTAWALEREREAQEGLRLPQGEASI